jgi:hypothetical protein
MSALRRKFLLFTVRHEWLAIIAFGLLLCLATFAPRLFAASLDVGIGRTYTNLAQDGQWWQSQNGGYSGTKTPTSFEVSLRDSFPQSYLGWKIGYADLGRITADNLVTNVDGETYDPTKPCNQATASNCLARVKGNGWIRGELLGLTLGRKFGDVTPELEIGRFFYRSRWTADITNIQWCAPAGCGAQFRSTDGGTQNNSTIYYGATLRYKFLYLSAREFQNVSEGQTGLTGGRARTATIGVSIDF